MPSRSAVFSPRIEGRHSTCTFPPALPAASLQPCHSVSDSREWPRGRRGEGDTGNSGYVDNMASTPYLPWETMAHAEGERYGGTTNYPNAPGIPATQSVALFQSPE